MHYERRLDTLNNDSFKVVVAVTQLGLALLQSHGQSVGFPREEYWNGLSFPFPGNPLHPGIESASPALALLLHWHCYLDSNTLQLSHQGSWCFLNIQRDFRFDLWTDARLDKQSNNEYVPYLLWIVHAQTTNKRVQQSFNIKDQYIKKIIFLYTSNEDCKNEIKIISSRIKS